MDDFIDPTAATEWLVDMAVSRQVNRQYDNVTAIVIFLEVPELREARIAAQPGTEERRSKRRQEVEDFKQSLAGGGPGPEQPPDPLPISAPTPSMVRVLPPATPRPRARPPHRDPPPLHADLLPSPPVWLPRAGPNESAAGPANRGRSASREYAGCWLLRRALTRPEPFYKKLWKSEVRLSLAALGS